MDPKFYEPLPSTSYWVTSQKSQAPKEKKKNQNIPLKKYFQLIKGNIILYLSKFYRNLIDPKFQIVVLKQHPQERIQGSGEAENIDLIRNNDKLIEVNKQNPIIICISEKQGPLYTY